MAEATGGSIPSLTLCLMKNEDHAVIHFIEGKSDKSHLLNQMIPTEGFQVTTYNSIALTINQYYVFQPIYV